jgi:hypothetical protein
MADTEHDFETESRDSTDRGSDVRRKRRRRLSLGTRVLAFAIGWTLLLVGVAGLALPGIQGILTILIGVAVLSLASETAYRLLKRLLHRWPPLWNRIERWRERVHDWLHPHDKA